MTVGTWRLSVLIHAACSGFEIVQWINALAVHNFNIGFDVFRILTVSMIMLVDSSLALLTYRTLFQCHMCSTADAHSRCLIKSENSDTCLRPDAVRNNNNIGVM